MTVAADTSIVLDAHEPKKNATVATGLPVPGTTDVAIWAGSSVDPELCQSIVGGFKVLLATVLTNMSSNPVSAAMPLGGGSADVVIDGAGGAALLSIYIGSELASKEQSHFVERTTKRLIERWLEENK